MEQLLTTKLYIPPTRQVFVHRPQLIERLDENLHRKLTLISAPAGFGKTTLVTEWLDKMRLDATKGIQAKHKIAWLSLDEGDNDPVRFLTYFITSLNRIEGEEAALGKMALGMLQAQQPPPPEDILISLINDFAEITDKHIFVLDDYHLIEAQVIDDALTFLLENIPPQLHLVITTREDPSLPLAKLRARGQLAELRATDMQFSSSEASEFFTRVMGLSLTAENVAVLETRTEGWVAGLQLAAISMQGNKDPSSFIKSFSGSHHFILDYLVEEVLLQQSKSIQNFLLQTSILKRLCGPLCDAVLLNDTASGQESLEYLEQNNLFLVPLDNERRWYRYHHLFADLLKQRLSQSTTSSDEKTQHLNELHTRASEWYERNGLEIEAFEHAVAANDIERAERIVEGDGVPMHFRGAGSYVLNWLETLPKTVLKAKPSLQVMYASTLLFVGQHTAVKQELQAAEDSLQNGGEDDKISDLLGRIAAIRSTLAVIQNDVKTIIDQALRAQEHLHSDNIIFRSIATWSLGVAHQFKGDLKAASEAFTETIAIGGDSIYTIAATINLGQIQENDTQLSSATSNYKKAVELGGKPPQLITCEANLGLARIYYELNDLTTAQQYGQQALHLMQQMEKVDSFASYGIFLAHLMLAQGNIHGAVNILNEAEAYVQRHNFDFRMPDIAAAQVLALLRQGNLKAAADLAQDRELPLSRARVHLAKGDSSAALALLEPLRQQTNATSWRYEQLKILILSAIAHHTHGNKDEAMQALGDALTMTAPEGYIRSFVDEAAPMEELLSEAITQGIKPKYSSKLLTIIKADKQKPVAPPVQALINPLSKRELEILALIAAGLKNKEIAEKLFVSLNTILYHVKNIYNKLGVNKRTLAILKARELNLLQDE